MLGINKQSVDSNRIVPDLKTKMAKSAYFDRDVKIILDPVYGTIPLDRLAVMIIDTEWFQRLRYIKQLALADYVYPGAVHTRFAHSIGVYHLARQMIKQIETHPPDAEQIETHPPDAKQIETHPPDAEQIETHPPDAKETKYWTNWHKRCIRVAALCHDLGHGPFSHLYEQIGKELKIFEIKHEDISKVVMEKILRGHPDFETCFDDKLDDAINLIKKLIKYQEDPTTTKEENLNKFMFQIVANKDSGVDVDKWDYFNRDAIACGVPERFQYDRALSVARVVKMKKNGGNIKEEEENMLELAYRDYDATNFYNMYNTRLTMYRKVYKHKAVVALDIMMKDVFKLVLKKPKNSNPEGGSIDLFPIRNEKDLTDDKKLADFLNLNDSVLFTIKEKYKAAGTVIDRIHKRDLYKMIIDILVPEDEDPKGKKKEIPEDEDAKGKGKEIPEDEDAKGKGKEILEDEDEDAKGMEKEILEDEDAKGMEKEVRDKIKKLMEKFHIKIRDVEIKKITFDYGNTRSDPISKLCFYKKDNDSGYRTSRNRVSHILPSSFQEVHLRVYAKKQVDKKFKKFKKALEDLEKKLHDSGEAHSDSNVDSDVQKPTSV